MRRAGPLARNGMSVTKGGSVIIVDGHQDIAYNALRLGRDYRRAAWDIRRAEVEAGLAAKRGLAANGLPDALLGRVGVIFATLFAESAWSPFKSGDSAGYTTPQEAYQQALRQWEYYQRLADEHEQIDLITSRAELDAVLSGEGDTLKREMAELLPEKEVLDVFLLRDDPERALAAAAQAGYSFLQEHFRRRIDLGNIKVFVRARFLGLSVEKLEARLLEGGFMRKKEFVDRYPLASVEPGEFPDLSPYRELWEKGLAAFQQRETFISLERGMEDFLMNDLRRARTVTFGPEPVFAYGLAKEKELSLVRLIGVGKMNALPADVLKERISATYV